MPCDCMRIEYGICGHCRTSLALSGQLDKKAERVNDPLPHVPTLREMEEEDARMEARATRRARRQAEFDEGVD